MSYQVLARKWRPQSFGELIGQEPIVVALRNALTDGRIAQAYLFSGIRGVGKTTAARLLAKALNCERGPAAEPCNECVQCREIIQGADLDVVEVDAATYSKVEQIRDLTESLQYSPARDRYKVVVLDEVHRLSRQAFDALLKIVEEPPKHLVFIFATTEIDAVPATILSRCQEFHFRRVPAPRLVAHLRTVSDAEGIEASDTALRLVARAGEGSVRDAVALLDQLATFGGGSIPEGEAIRLLGGLDTALFRDLLEAIATGRPAVVSQLAARVEDEGWDPRQVYAQFLAYCRDGLHLCLGGNADLLDLPAEDAAALAGLARSVGYENLLRMMHHLLGSELAVKRSEAATLALEIAWLRAAELPKLTRVEEILGGGITATATSEAPSAPPRTSGASTASASTPSAPAAGPSEVGPSTAGTSAAGNSAPAASDPAMAPAVSTLATSTSETATSEETARPAPVAQEPAPPSAAPPVASGPGADPVRALLDHLHRLKPSLAVRLEAAKDVRLVEGRLEVSLTAKEMERFRATLDRGTNREVFEEALATTLGDGAAWTLRETTPPPQAASPAESDATDPAAEDPSVQTVLDLFGGRVESVDD